MTAADPLPTSLDQFMGGALTIEQPVDGYRAAIDPVLLAAAINAGAGERVLDAGAGVGTAGLCLARRLDGFYLTGLERSEVVAEIFGRNIRQNGLDHRIQAVCGDLFEPPADIGLFDQIISNPPYLSLDLASASPNPLKNEANLLDHGDLGDWISGCIRLLGAKGYLTLILRADHLDQALAAIGRKMGGVIVYPLWPRPGKAAKRIIIRARKGSRAPMTLAAGLTLHNPDGSYTPAADLILRGQAAIDLAL